MRTFLLWLARLFNIPLVLRPDEAYILAAKEHILHVENQQVPWERKQRQVQRALSNTFKNTPLRDLNLALEIAVQECLASK